MGFSDGTAFRHPELRRTKDSPSAKFPFSSSFAKMPNENRPLHSPARVISMSKHNYMPPTERPYCPGNRAEVWRDKDFKDCPELAGCPECSGELEITPVQQEDEWAAYIPVHRIPF